MGNNKELIAELEHKFEALKKELKLKSSLAEIDKCFFVRDYIMKEGYVSENLSNQIRARMSDYNYSWTGYLHGLVVPNPHSMLSISESKIFSKEEKDDIVQLMNQIMALVSTNSLANVTKDKALEAKFIDDNIKLWNEKVTPKVKEIMQKVNNYWIEEAKR